MYVAVSDLIHILILTPILPSMSVEGSNKREASPQQEALDETAKRARLDPELQPETTPTTTMEQNTDMPLTYPHARPNNEQEPAVISKMGLKPALPIMPPSLELITGVKADLRARKGFVGQEEVGIMGYAGDPAFKGVNGVIKQRCVPYR
jgi:tRNA pseudouridine13 synthase